MLTEVDVKAALGVSRLPARQRTPRLVRACLSDDALRTCPRLANMLADPELNAPVLEQMLSYASAIREPGADLEETTTKMCDVLTREYVDGRARSDPS